MAQSHNQGKTLKAHTVNCLCPNAGLKHIHSPENKVITDYSESKRTRPPKSRSSLFAAAPHTTDKTCPASTAEARVQAAMQPHRGPAGQQGFCHKTTSQDLGI